MCCLNWKLFHYLALTVTWHTFKVFNLELQTFFKVNYILHSLTLISSRLRTKGSFEMGHPTLARHTGFVCTVPRLQSLVYAQQYFISTVIINRFLQK